MKVSLFLVSIFFLLNQNAFAESVDITIQGKSYSCKTPTNKVVYFYDYPSIAQVARTKGGAYANFIPQLGYTINVDPDMLNTMPLLGGMFLVYHECAHIALPMSVGAGSDRHEKLADCYAVKSMKKNGLFTKWKPLAIGLSAVMKNGGSHSLSTKRIGDMKQCFDSIK